MKNSRNPIPLFLLFSVALFALVACKPAGESASSDSGVLRAIPEQADVAMYFNQKAMSESAISEAMESMADDMDDPSDVLGDKITEMTGLEEDDLVDMAIALSNIDAFATDPTAVKISGAAFVSKPVTAEQIAEALEVAAKENGEEIDVTVRKGEGVDYVDIPKEEDMPEIVVAVQTGSSDTLAFFGDQASVEAALGRETASVPAALSAPSAGLIDGQQGWVSFILTDQLKAQLAGAAAQGVQMAPGLEKIESLQSVGVGMKAADSLDIAIGLNLGSAEDATVIAGVLNNQLISFAKMMIAGQMPEPLPLMETLSASSDGDRAKLAVSISVTDLEIVQSQMASFMPGNMGGM